MKPKEYDVIAIGTGSAMNIIEPIFQRNPNFRIALIDKDEPGGICLTKGCIPTKILLYPAELVRTIETSGAFGIDAQIKKVDFAKVMNRMRTMIHEDMAMIKRGLSHSSDIDYYQDIAEFVSPYTLKVGNELISSKLIFLCTGSRPLMPRIKGIDEIGYLTSDTVLEMKKPPKSLTIIGGGYIAAEYGHFFSSMGSKVTIIGRNPQFLPREEKEVSAVVMKELSAHMDIITNHEVVEVEKSLTGGKKVVAVDRGAGKKASFTAEELLVAAGRASNSDILTPEKAGIKTDARGWIVVNEYLETSQPGIWAMGDATGKHLFKHVANYESKIVYYNAILKRRIKVDYHAVPSAVFTYPEVARVGMGEEEAVRVQGKDNVLIGFQKYENTAKGSAMNAKDYFVKVILHRGTNRILGAHIVGPHASILIQEIINIMYTKDRGAYPITEGMHIHPALSEVVERAFYSLMNIDQYHQMLSHKHRH